MSIVKGREGWIHELGLRPVSWKHTCAQASDARIHQTKGGKGGGGRLANGFVQPSSGFCMLRIEGQDCRFLLEKRKRKKRGGSNEKSLGPESPLRAAERRERLLLGGGGASTQRVERKKGKNGSR